MTLFVQQFDGCPPSPQVSRTDFDINVTVKFGLCVIPPTVVTHALELGVLPAGVYHVTVAYGGLSTPATYSFAVLDSNSSVRVMQSIGSTAGGTTVSIVVGAAHCLNRPPSACPAPSITFGGVPAANIVVLDQSHFTATTPAHAAGAVLVKVIDSDFTVSSYAFRYVDPAQAPPSKFYEKILVPVIFNGPGALGARWLTELSLRNNNLYAVEPWRAIAGVAQLAPSKPVLFGEGSEPSGLFLILPRQAAPAVAIHAAVHDTSHAEGDGPTEIPIVRETRFSTNGIDLLDVPADPRSRTMLRVYSPTNPLLNYQAMIHVIVYSMTDGKPLRDFYPLLANESGCTDAVTCAEHPSSVVIRDLTAGLPKGRVGIHVQALPPIWAFATVTNNDTQRVTVISPH